MLHTNSTEVSPFVKLTVAQITNKFPDFYGNRRFISTFIRACHWFLSLSKWIQSIVLHLISLRSILILTCHLRLGLPSEALGKIWACFSKVWALNCFTTGGRFCACLRERSTSSQLLLSPANTDRHFGTVYSRPVGTCAILLQYCNVFESHKLLHKLHVTHCHLAKTTHAEHCYSPLRFSAKFKYEISVPVVGCLN